MCSVAGNENVPDAEAVQDQFSIAPGAAPHELERDVLPEMSLNSLRCDGGLCGHVGIDVRAELVVQPPYIVGHHVLNDRAAFVERRVDPNQPLWDVEVGTPHVADTPAVVVTGPVGVESHRGADRTVGAARVDHPTRLDRVKPFGGLDVELHGPVARTYCDH